MNLTLQVKLQPTDQQEKMLRKTMERFNAACDAIAVLAFEKKLANKVELQKLCYHDIRKNFGLGAQMTIRAIAKVVEVYKRDKKIKPKFRPLGAIVYDQRILSWKGIDRVSILTLDGRQIMPVVMGDYQQARFDRVRGQADLTYRDGMFFLYVVVDVSQPTPYDPDGFLGIDLGIKNIAADSDGNVYSGDQVNGLRRRHANLRRRLQKKGTKSAKRLLKKRRIKESRFAANVNHTIAKRIVATAFDTGRGIALEDLKGIRDRITVRKRQRRQHHSWAFHQQRSFIEYKSRLLGVPRKIVDPRNSSRECPECHHVEKANRKTRDWFECKQCGHAGPADNIAGRNLSARASVMTPHAGQSEAKSFHAGLASPVL